jgi:predicted ATPase
MILAVLQLYQADAQAAAAQALAASVAAAEEQRRSIAEAKAQVRYYFVTCTAYKRCNTSIADCCACLQLKSTLSSSLLRTRYELSVSTQLQHWCC